MKRYQIRVIGKVQGVYFRFFTQRKAKELGLSGWVKNDPDLSVLIEVQGTQEKIEKFKSWCYKGSPFSKVKEVTSNEIPVILDEINKFEIIRKEIK
jgi:acylphosphatase